MRPERASRRVDGIAHARARMYEFNVPEGLAQLETAGSDPAKLLSLVIGILGDEAARIAGLDIDGEDSVGRILPNEPPAIRFAAEFLHAYVSSQYGASLATELLLLSGAGYYLCDLAGSASVLVREAAPPGAALDYWGELLRLLLSPDQLHLPDQPAAHPRLASSLQGYFSGGNGREEVLAAAKELRTKAYSGGTPRDLLFADLASAVARKRLENAARSVLPLYSGLGAELWSAPFDKPSFMRELWPSQHVFGEQGLLQGRSAVVQMPTSAGKTRGVELIIRSAFYSERARLAIVVAPFRALCTEITGALRTAFKSENVRLNELSDALLVDYSAVLKTLFPDAEEAVDLTADLEKQIIVLTPEKLLYVLRHTPELIDAVGLVIYDEGHQFDSGQRGVTYELLLTSIKRLLPEEKQVVLISAVITNAEEIGRWLIGDQVVVVDGKDLSTTRRSVAFVSWRGRLGQLRFVEPSDPEHEQYFVPRLVEQHQLALRGRERTPRVFPERDSKSVALYLGMQAVRNGSVAIFCGRKSTAGAVAATAVEAFERGLPLPRPSLYCDPAELANLGGLYAAHFGEQEFVSRAARLGVFSHHGNTPQGVRLSVEVAIKEGLAKFVICTSTLAQGVNLPLRYLIVAGTMQGADRIKARDFQNLIGRAGRAGMHTEGTIIFADPSLYDTRHIVIENWRWNEAVKLLNPDLAEQTTSSLLQLLAPLTNQRGDRRLKIDPNGLLRKILQDPGALQAQLIKAANKNAQHGFTGDGLLAQVKAKTDLIEALESYLMANRGADPFEVFIASVEGLARETLAFALADDTQKARLVQAFQDLARHIESNQPDAALQAAYGKTLLGLEAMQRVRGWVEANQEILLQPGNTEEELLAQIWALIAEILGAEVIGKYTPSDQLLPTTMCWISGANFQKILASWVAGGGRMRWGTKTRDTTMEDMVHLCENVIAYESTLVLAAASEMLLIIAGEEATALAQRLLAQLLKRMKYGLSHPDEIALYELGFSDRIAAHRIRLALPEQSTDPIRSRLRGSAGLSAVLDSLPRYFRRCYESLI